LDFDCSYYQYTLPYLNFDFHKKTHSTIFSIPPSSYLIEGDEYDELYSGQCIVGVVSKNSSSWDESYYIFGQAFLASYYTIFNYSSSEIGFALSANSDARIEGVAMSKGILSVIIIASILFLSLIVFIIIFKMRKGPRPCAIKTSYPCSYLETLREDYCAPIIDETIGKEGRLQ